MLGRPDLRHHRTEPLTLTDKPLDPASLQGAGQFDRNLARSVEAINANQKDMSKAKLVADRLAALKQKHSDNMDSLLAKIEDTDRLDTEVSQRAHSHVEGVRSQVDEIDAGLRLLSNEA